MNGFITKSRLFMAKLACRHVYMSVCSLDIPKQFSTCIDTAMVFPHIQSSSPLMLDMTLGEGGNTKDLLDNTAGKVVGLDCDPMCMQTISGLKKKFGDRFTGYIGKWSELPKLLGQDGMEQGCDAMVMDMGVSSKQLLDRDRGFNMENGKLDLRFSMQGLTCEQILKHVELDNLSKILKVYGGVLKSKTIARDILERKFLMEEIRTSEHLFEVLKSSHDRDEFWQNKEDPLKYENIKKVFLGLRMFINDELNEMEFAIQVAETVLVKGGLLVCGMESEQEQNLITKFIFRKPVTLGEEGGSDVVWEMVESTDWSKDYHGERRCLVFRKC